ncbi:hypothetical protein [Fluviicola sp.]|jgi:hypothetical protein|uniref:hypothetical protein n=1 Tax=Fluviicola sp. TaxID=1917219 RepID=UPI0028269BCD|nr:hypothetical protein [Fluviicola sp.]MDR0802097.1 hypothetical protein [Fluviicola sp.]
MRYFTFFVLTCFFALTCKAQSQENVMHKNTNTNTNYQQTQGNIVTDTVREKPVLEERTIQSEKSGTYKSVSNPWFDVEKKDANFETSAQQLQSAKYQFETNYSNSRHQLYRRSPSPQELSNMRQSAQLYSAVLPESFENYFYNYLLNKYNPQQFPELEKAAILNPNQTEVQQELAVYGIATNNRKLSDSVTLQMINQNKITEGILAYAADLVNSVPGNSTLLLHGYTELISANYQVNLQNRTNIELISADLMQSPAYQENLSSKGFIMPGSTYVDTTFVREFCSLNASRNICLSMSFPKEYFQGISQSLNPVGLTFAYNSTIPDRNAWNMNLVQSVWKKDLLGISKDAQSDALSANYLPTLISIEQLYREYNRSEEAKEMSQLILSVATRAKKTGQLSKIKR